MTRILLSVFLAIAACVPLLLLVADLAQNYPPDESLLAVGLVDAALLLGALALPLVVLPRLGVAWRTRPEEY